jgi:iron(III) transport system permease protein
VLAGLLLTFVDIMKELPMTLLLSPFNFNTLATLTYQFAKDEMLEDAALPALLIVLAGLLPVIIINRSLAKPRHQR